MKKIIHLFTLLILLSCGKEKRDERIYSIDKFMQGQVDYFKFNGNILVAEKGQIIYQKSFGFTDFDTKQPLNDSSVFELASISKQFTAAGILLLKQQGKLNLTDTLRKFFPELPYNNVTIHHLLTHTSGLPEYIEMILSDNYLEDKWDHKQIAFNNDVINLLAKEKRPIHSKPGQKWRYSNSGYAILASIIEKVSGQTFKNFMAENIFEPLDMKFSRVYNTRRSGETIKTFAYGYLWSDSLNRFVLSDSDEDMLYFLDGIYGGSGISSTTGDLLKWDRAVVSQTLLGEATSKEFLFPHAVCDTMINGHYAYGVYVGKNQFGNYAYHSGGLPGYGHNYARYIDEDKTIIVLSNNQLGSMGSIAINATIVNILYNKQVESPYRHTYFALDTLSLDSFTGSYSVKNWEVDIKRGKNNLYQVFKGMRINFQPESNSKIYSTDAWDIQYEIVKGADKSIKYFRILYGVRDEMKKLK